MHRKKVSTTVTLAGSCLVFLMISACSGSAASKGTFKKVLAKQYSTNPVCFSLRSANGSKIEFPNTVTSGSFGMMQVYDALVDAKVPTKSKETEVTVRDGFSSTRKAMRADFSLTDLGSQFYNSDLQTFCLQQISVESVDNFTEPQAMMGQTFSEILYSIKADSIPQWLLTTPFTNSRGSFPQARPIRCKYKANSYRELIPGMLHADGVAKAVQCKGALMLTDNGWQIDGI